MRLPRLLRLLSALSAAIALSAPALAQNPPPARQESELEKLMEALQANRGNQLYQEMIAQATLVKANNDLLVKLTEAYGGLLKGRDLFPKDAPPGARIGDTRYKDGTLEMEINSAFMAAGMAPFKPENGPDSARGRTLEALKGLHAPNAILVGGIGVDTTKGQIERVLDTIRKQLEVLNMTQYLDLQRLQALSRKRQEALEIADEFVKKMLQSRDAIIGNIR